MAGLAGPTAPAFGEGSVEYNAGPGTAVRQALLVTTFPRGLKQVYARAGETLQLGSSAVGVGAGTIRVYAPGADLATAAPLVDCVLDQPGTGHIASRAEELAGPAPNPGGWTPCELPATTDGIYTVYFAPEATTSQGAEGTVDNPNTGPGQLASIPIFDVTVRDAGGAVKPGRLFADVWSFGTAGPNTTGLIASTTNSYVYTKTGYEYRINFFNHRGINWQMTADDMGVVDAVTGDRIYASFEYAESNASPVYPEAVLAPADRRFPQFFNRIDPEVISGPGGLAQTRGFATTAIAPSTRPLANLAFSGAAGQAGATKRGEGGTISFTAPTQLEGLGYAVVIDTNRDGTFGNASDFADDTRELESDGTQAYAWNGRDAAGNVPACGNYQYQIRSSLSEVHFTANDVEESGGMQIQRLTRTSDPDLGSATAMSYNDIDPYKFDQVTNTVPDARTDFDSSQQPFHDWSNNSGDTSYVDTWTKLPDVKSTGTLRLLCADPQVVKSATPDPAVPGQELTFRLDVKNNGPDAATDVIVTDKLPSDVTFQSASAGCAEAAGTVTCTAGSLQAGSTRTFEVVVDVPSSVSKCIENIATVANTTFDTNVTNNESQICVPIDRKSDLSIKKDPSSATVSPGGQVMYTLVVRNHGPSDDKGVEVSDPMAAGLSLVSAKPSQGRCTTTNNTVACDLGGLKDGGSAQVLVTAKVTVTVAATAGGCGSGGTATTIDNTAHVRGANQDTNAANNQDPAQICIEPPPPSRFDLVVSKHASDRSLLVGQTVTYRVVVHNNGPATAPD